MKLSEILNEREDMRSKLTKIEIEDFDMSDYPRFTDAHVSSAVWKETGKALTDDELKMLNDKYPEVANAEAQEKTHDYGEYQADMAEDR